MSIFSKLGKAVTKTVKKVAKPVKKLATSELGKQALGPVNSALLSGGSPSDMFKNIQSNYMDMANNPLVRGAIMAETGVDPAMINSLVGGSSAQSDNTNLINSAIGGDFQTTRGLPSSFGLWDKLKDIFNAKDQIGNIPIQFPNGTSMGDLRKFENQTQNSSDSQPDYYKDQMVLDSQGRDVTNIPWYNKVGSALGSAGSSVANFVKNNPTALGTAAQLGGGLAGYLASNAGYKPFIESLQRGENLDLQQMGSSAYENLLSSPEYAIQKAYMESGTTPQDELALEQERRAILANRQAQNAALTEQLQRRGQAGSGAEIASQIAGTQQDANDARMNMLQRNAQRAANRLNASQAGMQVRSNVAGAQDARSAGNTSIANQQAMARLNATRQVGQAKLQQAEARGGFFGQVGNTVAAALNPQTRNTGNAISDFNNSQQETEEQKKKRLGLL